MLMELRKLVMSKRKGPRNRFICFTVMTGDKDGRPYGWKWLVLVTLYKNYHLFPIGYETGK